MGSFTRSLRAVLADGMGGHLHGEVAAQIAVQYITENFQREAKPDLKDPFLFLSGALLFSVTFVANTVAEVVRIEWPSGIVQELTNVAGPVGDHQ